MNIRLNDAWNGIPLEFVDDVLAYFEDRLQETHPLRGRKLFPFAKRERGNKYLLEDDDDGQSVWILDFGAKKRIKGRTCYVCKQLKSQQEFDEMMTREYEEWVRQMKEAGAWGD